MKRPDRQTIRRASVNCRPAILLLIAIALAGPKTFSQDTYNEPVLNECETWTRLSISKKLFNQVKLYVEPELRFKDGFSLDKYMMETGAKYEPLDFIEIGASYRFVGNKRVNKGTEYLHRYAFDLEFEKDIRRFEPEFRIRYTNFSDDDLDADYLRYKAGLKYDIPGCKITPFIAAQAFHSLSIHKIEKMRYAAGMEYKLLKNNYIGLFYKLDYYRLEYRNRHILGITYRLKL